MVNVHVCYNSPCADRSGGPPKPGRRLFLVNGVRWCRRRSAGCPLGPDEPPAGRPVGTPWRAQGVRTVTSTSIVHRYGTVGPSVEPRQVPSCQNIVPTGICRNPTGPDEPRRITRLSRISVRLMYGLIRDHKALYSVADRSEGSGK